MTRLKQRIYALGLIAAMMVTAVPTQAFAAESNHEDSKKISEITVLSEAVAEQEFTVGSEDGQVTLPDTIEAKVVETTWAEMETASENEVSETEWQSTISEETANLEVVWTEADGKEFSTEEVDAFTYTATVKDEAYSLAEGIEMPTITVDVVETESTNETTKSTEDDASNKADVAPVFKSADINAGATGDGGNAKEGYAIYICEGETNHLYPADVNGVKQGNIEFADRTTKLTHLFIDSSVINIKGSEFKDCTNLESIDFSKAESLRYIQSYAFTGCEKLQSLEFYFIGVGGGIEKCAFLNCTGLETVDFTKCYNLFYLCDSFVGCENLKNIDFYEEGIVEFYTPSFYMCTTLKSITLPKSVVFQYGYTNPFVLCSNLETIEIHPDCKNLVMEDGVLFSNQYNGYKGTLTAYLATNQNKNYTVPVEVEVLADGAFAGNRNLQEIKFLRKVELPNSSSVGLFYGIENAEYLKIKVPSSMEKGFETKIFDTSNVFTIGDKDEDSDSVKSQVEKMVVGYRSETSFDGGLTLDQETYKYGDTITITAKPVLTGEETTNTTITIMENTTEGLTAPTANQIALFDGDKQISEAFSPNEDGIYNIEYDTSDGYISTGTHNITVKYIGDEDKADKSGLVSVTIEPTEIKSATVTDNQTKPYDGNVDFTDVELDLGIEDANVTATAKGTRASADIDGDGTFTATEVTFGGIAAGCYTLDIANVSGSVGITKAELSVIGGTAESKMYDGTALATVKGLTFTGLVEGETLTLGTDYTVEAIFNDAAVGTGKAVTGTVTLLETNKTKNYTMTDDTLTGVVGDITIADGPAAPTNGVVDDENNNFAFDSIENVMYEYSIDGGTTWREITGTETTTTITLGNVAILKNMLHVRIKETATNKAGASLKNTEAFTATLEGSVSISGTTIYGETLTATVTDTQENAVLTYTWKADGTVLGTGETYVIGDGTVDKNISVKATAAGYNGSLGATTTSIVGKAEYEDVTTAAGSSIYGKTGSVDLATWYDLPGASFGTIEVVDQNTVLVDNSCKVENNKLVFEFVDDIEKINSTATITIPVTSTNYNDFDLTVTLTVLDKYEPVVTVTAYAKTYDKKAVTIEDITKTATYDGKALLGTWSFEEGTGEILNADDSGTKTLVFTPDNAEDYKIVNTTGQVTIHKIDAAVAVNDQSIIKGGTKPDLTFTQSGFLSGESISNVVMTESVDMDTVGAYTITPSGGTLANGEIGNYNITYTSGKLYITVDTELLHRAIKNVTNAKIGITTSDAEASSVASGTKFVPTAVMTAFEDAITDAKLVANTATTDVQVQDAIALLENAVITFKAAIKTGTYVKPSSGSSNNSNNNSAQVDNSTVIKDTEEKVEPTPEILPSLDKIVLPTISTEKKEDVVTNPDQQGEMVEIATTPLVIGNRATVDVKEDHIEQAIKLATSEEPVVTINVPTVEKVDVVRIDFPTKSLRNIVAKENVSLAISSGTASVVFDGAALAAIVDGIEGDKINLVVKKVPNGDKSEDLTTKQQEVIGDNMVYDLSLSSYGKKISDFKSGKATVTIPLAAETILGDEVYVYYVSLDGDLEEVESSYNIDSNEITFVAYHFSHYMISSTKLVEDEIIDDGTIEDTITDADINQSSDKVLEETQDSNLVLPIIAIVVILIGTVVGIVIRRKNK